MKFVYTLLLLAFSVGAHTQIDTVLNRYKRYVTTIVQPGAIDSNWLQPDTDGRWVDINYLDTERAAWQVQNHLKRIRSLAMVCTDPRSRFYHNPVYWRTINAALDHWLLKRYKNSNWWHNEIGIPQYMRDIVVLLRDQLTTVRLQQALEVMAQYHIYPNTTGANLVWSADLGLHYGALKGDTALMRDCLQRIYNEIKITTGDGIQPDHSFHQHGARLMMYQYGRAFLRDNIRLAWQVAGTGWAFPEEKTSLLTSFILEGWQWMARGIHTAPGTMDRSVSRANELRNADLRDLLPYLATIDPKKKEAFRALKSWQNNDSAALKGFRYYPYSDFSVYHNPQFSFFLKTMSDRTLPTESINSENLKGKLLNSGDGYIIRNGNEYFNLMPVWNWNRLPGVTTFEGADSLVRRPFTGSVGNGQSGATVMDYRMKDKSGRWISTKKLWAFHNNRVVCLIAGIENHGVEGEVVTALDQCRLQGNVELLRNSGPVEPGDGKPRHNTQGIHHAGIAYIFFNWQPIKADSIIVTATGSWYDINRSASHERMTEDLFTPVLLHDPGVSAAYMITGAKTPAQANALISKPGCKILGNTSSNQAVYFDDLTCMIAFYKAGSAMVHKQQLTVDQPCLLMVSNKTIYVNDPSQQAKQVTLTFNGKKTVIIPLPAYGGTSAPVPLP